MRLFWQCLQPTKSLHLVLRQKVGFSCIKQGCIFERRRRKRQRHFSAPSADCSLPGRSAETKKDAEVLSTVPSLAVNLRLTTSLHQREWHTRAHTPQTRARSSHQPHFLRTVPGNLLSPNYSRLEPMLLSLILSVRGLWGNSDISVWCLAYVSRALPGPIKLIFNVCPTLDGQSQGWHSSRGDINGVWWRPRRALGCSLWDLRYGRTSVTLQLKHLQWTSPAAQIRDKNTSDWSDC